MQRPVRGFRGGSHLIHTHGLPDEHDRRLSLSNTSSDELEDDSNENDSTIKSKDSLIFASVTGSADIETAIRNLRPLTTRKKKKKKRTNPNISSQKADLPQLNMITDKTNNLNEPMKDKQSHHWFPKPDIGHIDPNDFIRHNHVGKWRAVFLGTKK